MALTDGMTNSIQFKTTAQTGTNRQISDLGAIAGLISKAGQAYGNYKTAQNKIQAQEEKENYNKASEITSQFQNNIYLAKDKDGIEKLRNSALDGLVTKDDNGNVIPTQALSDMFHGSPKYTQYYIKTINTLADKRISVLDTKQDKKITETLHNIKNTYSQTSLAIARGTHDGSIKDMTMEEIYGENIDTTDPLVQSMIASYTVALINQQESAEASGASGSSTIGKAEYDALNAKANARFKQIKNSDGLTEYADKIFKDYATKGKDGYYIPNETLIKKFSGNTYLANKYLNNALSNYNKLSDGFDKAEIKEEKEKLKYQIKEEKEKLTNDKDNLKFRFLTMQEDMLDGKEVSIEKIKSDNKDLKTISQGYYNKLLAFKQKLDKAEIKEKKEQLKYQLKEEKAKLTNDKDNLKLEYLILKENILKGERVDIEKFHSDNQNNKDLKTISQGYYNQLLALSQAKDSRRIKETQAKIKKELVEAKNLAKTKKKDAKNDLNIKYLEAKRDLLNGENVDIDSFNNNEKLSKELKVISINNYNKLLALKQRLDRAKDKRTASLNRKYKIKEEREYKNNVDYQYYKIKDILNTREDGWEEKYKKAKEEFDAIETTDKKFAQRSTALNKAFATATSKENKELIKSQEKKVDEYIIKVSSNADLSSEQKTELISGYLVNQENGISPEVQSKYIKYIQSNAEYKHKAMVDNKLQSLAKITVPDGKGTYHPFKDVDELSKYIEQQGGYITTAQATEYTSTLADNIFAKQTEKLGNAFIPNDLLVTNDMRESNNPYFKKVVTRLDALRKNHNDNIAITNIASGSMTIYDYGSKATKLTEDFKRRVKSTILSNIRRSSAKNEDGSLDIQKTASNLVRQYMIANNNGIKPDFIQNVAPYNFGLYQAEIEAKSKVGGFSFTDSDYRAKAIFDYHPDGVTYDGFNQERVVMKQKETSFRNAVSKLYANNLSATIEEYNIRYNGRRAINDINDMSRLMIIYSYENGEAITSDNNGQIEISSDLYPAAVNWMMDKLGIEETETEEAPEWAGLGFD